MQHRHDHHFLPHINFLWHLPLVSPSSLVCDEDVAHSACRRRSLAVARPTARRKRVRWLALVARPVLCVVVLRAAASRARRRRRRRPVERRRRRAEPRARVGAETPGQGAAQAGQPDDRRRARRHDRARDEPRRGCRAAARAGRYVLLFCFVQSVDRSRDAQLRHHPNPLSAAACVKRLDGQPF